MPPKNRSPSSPFEAKFDEAEALQQRGERRRGAEAAALFEKAAEAYQEALALGPPPGRVVDCYFALAETCQSWAEALLAACASLPDAELTLESERGTQQQAARLFACSVSHYRRVRVRDSGAGGADAAAGMRADAACNCGNTLASWASCVAAQQGPHHGAGPAAELLGQAEECYVAALAEEEDAVTWSNLGDALTQHGEVLCEQGSAAAAAAAPPLFARAGAAYARACGLSSSEHGDDLPGLLCNWAAGLLVAAVHTPDAAVAVSLLEEAACRLLRAAAFDRGDVAPHNALGDVLVARAERAQREGDAVGARSALQRAMREGYSAALRINAGDADAMVGTAEVHAQLARLEAAAGSAAAARGLWSQAAAAYEAALARPEALGRFSDRCDVRYNLACCLAQCGREPEAAQLVARLVAAGGVDAQEVQADPDLALLRGLQP